MRSINGCRNADSRQSSLYSSGVIHFTHGSPFALELGDQLRQFDQILIAEVGAARSDCHEGILSSGVCVTGQNRAQPPLLIKEADTVFAPIVAVIDQFELTSEPGMEWMGYPET